MIDRRLPYLSSCTLSDCERYRFGLRRQWDEAKPWLVYVMLNPSTADGTNDDPTIRKCVGFARQAGFGGISVVNLFSYRSTDPQALRRNGGPPLVGVGNDNYIRGECERNAVVLAWGANGVYHSERAKHVAALVQSCAAKVLVIDWTKTGHPVHPLMQPYAKGLNSYEARQ